MMKFAFFFAKQPKLKYENYTQMMTAKGKEILIYNEESNLGGFKFCLRGFQGFKLQMPMSNLRNLLHHDSSHDKQS